MWGPNQRFGRHSIGETLSNAHAHIDGAIRMAHKGKLFYPAYLLGQLSALCNAVNDHEYIRWRAAELEFELDQKYPKL